PCSAQSSLQSYAGAFHAPWVPDRKLWPASGASTTPTATVTSSFADKKGARSLFLEQLPLASLFYSMLAFGLGAGSQNVRLPGGLGDAVALPAREGELDRLGQVKLVADRGEDRLHAG